jgi:hypothetical protein
MIVKRILLLTVATSIIGVALGIIGVLVTVWLRNDNRALPLSDARSVADSHGVYLPTTAYLVSANERRPYSLLEGSGTTISLLCFGIPRDAFDETLSENRARHGGFGVREVVSSPMAEKAGWLKWPVNKCYTHKLNTNADSAFVTYCLADTNALVFIESYRQRRSHK